MIQHEIIPNHSMNSMLQLQALFPDIKVMIFWVGKNLMSQA
jgi:hypothetical protein